MQRYKNQLRPPPRQKPFENKTGVINDPLGQTHNPASSDHCSDLNIVWFGAILKSEDGQTDGSTDTTCEYSDHYQSWLWVVWVDQYQNLATKKLS